jgi:ADP-ribose pyrophosphatase YjhB (NUDIX family)
LGRHRSRNKQVKSIPTTRVSVIVINNDRKILLVKHRKGSRQYWVLPGGRLEYGETFQECAVRELKEETGLDVKVDKMIFVSEAIAPDRSRHIVNIYLLAHVIGGQMQLGDEAVLTAVDFLSINELKNLTLYPPIGEHILKGMDGKFSNGIKYLGNMWV